MFIRWLGAFGKGGTLKESLAWECSSPMRERACEELNKGEASELAKANGIGLLFNKTDITRKFKGDVWSLSEDKDVSSIRLFPTRKGKTTSWNKHTEAFIASGAKPTGIVLSAYRFTSVKKHGFLEDVYDIADSTGLTVYILDGKGQLKVFY